MELGFAMDFAGEMTSLVEIKKTLETLKKYGFTHVHWSLEWDGDYTYSIYEMKQIKEWFDEFGLKAKALHATKGGWKSSNVRRADHLRRDYTSCNEYNRLAGVELIRNRMQMAEILGAHELVLHMCLPYMSFREEPGYEELYYRQVFRSLDELREEAEERHIKICIENLLETPAKEQIEQFDRLFARYDKEYLGLCLDTGHGNVVFADQITELAERYAERIYAVHINDNLGGPAGGVDGKEQISWACDLHMIPGEGNVDWERMTDILAKSPYELPLLMEVFCKEDDLDGWLRRAYDAGVKMTEEIERKRQGV